MVKFSVKLADIVIGVTANYESTMVFCKDYLTSELPELEIEVKECDIEKERQRGENDNYTNEYLETLALYRKIAESLVEYDVILFHCSALSMNNQGCLFTAKSGTGKSTHARLWREAFGDEVIMINDDKPLIRIIDDKPYVFGTPWDGKHHLSNNIKVPVKSVAILSRSENNSIDRISKKEAFPIIYQQTYRPEDASKLMKVLSIIDSYLNSVNIFTLKCNMDIEAAVTSRMAMID